MAACKSATPPAEENLPTAEMAATVWARVHAEPCAHDGTSLSRLKSAIAARWYAGAATRQTRERPRTVQYHLHKGFTQLDITSHSQLARVPPSHLNTWQIGD